MAHMRRFGVTDIRKVRPYSSPSVLANVDGRTREARLMRDTRAELVAHVGGSPSATQRALIESAVQLSLRIALMDQEFARTGEMPDHTARSYLAWQNTLARTVTRLGIKAAPQVRTLQQKLAEHVAAGA